jgi:hypothetical protein
LGEEDIKVMKNGLCFGILKYFGIFLNILCALESLKKYKNSPVVDNFWVECVELPDRQPEPADISPGPHTVHPTATTN